MVAYRAEFLVWILTTNMPLVMMALWNAVAADGPVGRFGQRELNTYYLATLVVRILTSSWMVWELTMDIRQGRLATRLLRPLHPLLAYSAEHLAAVPMRALVVSPLIVLIVCGDARASWPLADPAPAGHLPGCRWSGAWLLLFFTMVLIGSLAMFVDSALSVFELWLGIHFVLSGYLVPIELLPGLGGAARPRPARSGTCWASRSRPRWACWTVHAALARAGRPVAVRRPACWWLALAVWRAGMRRFVAFGG